MNISGQPTEMLIDEWGDEWQTRAKYSSEGFFEIERGTELADAFNNWPSNDSKDSSLTALLKTRPSIRRCISAVIETGHTEDPTCYIVKEHRNENAESKNFNVRGLAICELPMNQRHAMLCAIEYNECRNSGQPSFYHIDQRVDELDRAYRRIIIPSARENGRTTELCVMSRKIMRPFLV